MTNALLSELHRTWARPEAAELAKLYALVSPNYGAVMESYVKAQDVARAPRWKEATPKLAQYAWRPGRDSNPRPWL